MNNYNSSPQNQAKKRSHNPIVTDITDALQELSKQIESIQKSKDSQHVTISKINRTSEAQLKEKYSLNSYKSCPSKIGKTAYITVN